MRVQPYAALTSARPTRARRQLLRSDDAIGLDGHGLRQSDANIDIAFPKTRDRCAATKSRAVQRTACRDDVMHVADASHARQPSLIVGRLVSIRLAEIVMRAFGGVHMNAKSFLAAVSAMSLAVSL